MKHIALLLILPTSVFADGAINPLVTQDNINQTICVKNWTKTIRPSAAHTNKIKKAMMKEAGIDWKLARQFELDHIVPLAVGGLPNKEGEPLNLMLQPWDGVYGARHKDRLEAAVHRDVCRGKISLEQGRDLFLVDWRAEYLRRFGH